MEKERIIKREVKIEGIADQGYGLAYQYVNRSKELTIEAKGIYNYLAAFAGNGTEAFPSVSLMLRELGISKTRFYKHRELLLEKGLIRVEQGRAKYVASGKVSYDTSLYILLTDYDKIEEQKQRYAAEKNVKSNDANNVKKSRVTNVKHTENKGFDVRPQNNDTRNGTTQNNDNNNNNLNNNNFNNNNITTTKEKDTNKKSSSSEVVEFSLEIKGITKTNIKRLGLNQEQIDLLESYVKNNEYENLDKFSYFIAKQIKAGAITKLDLKTSKSKKVTKNQESKTVVSNFEDTKDKFLEDAARVENEWLEDITL